MSASNMSTYDRTPNMDSLLLPHLDLVLDFENVTDNENLRNVVNVARSGWKDLALDIKPVLGGNLNRNFRIQPSDGSGVPVFLNVINPIATFMIPNHMKVIRLLSKVGIGPEIYVTFQNGKCTEFLPGSDLEQGQRHLLREPELLWKSAFALAEFHRKRVYDLAKELDIVKNLTNFPTDLVSQWWHIALGNENAPQELRSQLPDLERFLKEAETQRTLVETLGCEERLCHLDYNPSNMMLGPDGSFTTIDFDGSMISYPAFDIAYFFLFVFNNHFAPAESLVPTPDEYYSSWCQSYLTARNRFDGVGDPSEIDVRKLVFRIKKAMLTTYLRLTLSSGLLAAMGHAADPQQRLNFLKFSVNCWRAYQSSKDQVGAMTFTE